MDKCFVTAQHDDAEVIKVKTKDDEEAKDVKLVPGRDQFSQLSILDVVKMGKCFKLRLSMKNGLGLERVRMGWVLDQGDLSD